MGADVACLEVPVMALGEAAHQLGIPISTLKHWLDGHHVGERFSPPVLRPEPAPGGDVTWGEMVEAELSTRLPVDGRVAATIAPVHRAVPGALWPALSARASATLYRRTPAPAQGADPGRADGLSCG